MDSLFLQIFLLLNVFLMGGLAAIAGRHAYAHFRPKKVEAPKPSTPPIDPVHLPADVKDKLIHEAEANFLAILNSSVGELQHDLRGTAEQLNRQLAEFGAQITATERERYATTLEELRKQTAAAITAAQTEINNHQAELKAALAQEQAEVRSKLGEAVAAEQQRLIKQIDTRLADAVASFLLETLQHNVDLGSQGAYLTALLEEHKDEFKREVGDETAATK